jgi:acetoin utilization protein AcuB
MERARVASLMSPFPYHVDAAQDLWTARALMEQHGIRHLPVLLDGNLAGIVTHRDVQVAIAVAGEGASEVRIPVWSVCERDAYVVDLETEVAEVAETMANRQIGSAIVTKHGKLAGIITTVDVCRAYAKLVRVPRAPRDDVA